MKGMIYEFVKSTNPKAKVYVTDDLENLEENHEFVYGVGLKDKLGDVGITGINSRDLFRDAIIDRKWEPAKICKMVLAPSSARYSPYFKHLRNAGFLNEDGKIDENSPIKEFTPDFISKINKVSVETFFPPDSYSKKKDEINEKYDSFTALKLDCGFLHVLMFTPLLEPSKINVEELIVFLKANIDKLIEAQYGTHFRKLICLYDFLKYSLTYKK
jgi:hypothetical protein